MSQTNNSTFNHSSVNPRNILFLQVFFELKKIATQEKYNLKDDLNFISAFGQTITNPRQLFDILYPESKLTNMELIFELHREIKEFTKLKA